MTAALRLAASLVVSLLMWLPTVPGALEVSEDPARLAGRYLLALLIARVGVGLVFRVVGAYATPEAPEEEPEEPPAQAAADDGPSAFGRRRSDLIPASANTDQELFDEALNSVEDTAALVP